ncbi:hypothetical protein FIV00_26250 [Labrenzia sp. THAF82]|nr:hypothetical protein FIV00_26250 [Labrenzia sp. THAF82]
MPSVQPEPFNPNSNANAVPVKTVEVSKRHSEAGAVENIEFKIRSMRTIDFLKKLKKSLRRRVFRKKFFIRFTLAKLKSEWSLVLNPTAGRLPKRRTVLVIITQNILRRL